MKDSLAITAQAIPFLNDFKNNTFWTYCKKKRMHFPANPFPHNQSNYQNYVQKH